MRGYPNAGEVAIDMRQQASENPVYLVCLVHLVCFVA
jgi:hypothetical protein